MMTYDETMAYGAAQYADVLELLRHAGMGAEFIQTGGMNAAIIVPLEAGYHLLIADREDSLSWDRATHDGWYVGLYPHEDVSSEPIRWLESEDSTGEEVLRLIDRVMSLKD